MTAYWLMKGEVHDASIDHLRAAPHGTLAWTGVRNYQARNFMRDQMRDGDGVLLYHSSCAVPGIAGLARISGTSSVDPTQFDPASPYHDPRSPLNEPRWVQIGVSFVRKTAYLPLSLMRATPSLSSLQVLRRGNRLSITPITAEEWRAVLDVLTQLEAQR
jgi:predicted RNA-binding protein with PUA-like domain